MEQEQTKPRTKPMSFRLDEEAHKKLEELALGNKLTISEYVRSILNDVVDGSDAIEITANRNAELEETAKKVKELYTTALSSTQIMRDLAKQFQLSIGSLLNENSDLDKVNETLINLKNETLNNCESLQSYQRISESVGKNLTDNLTKLDDLIEVQTHCLHGKINQMSSDFTKEKQAIQTKADHMKILYFSIGSLITSIGIATASFIFK